MKISNKRWITTELRLLTKIYLILIHTTTLRRQITVIFTNIYKLLYWKSGQLPCNVFWWIPFCHLCYRNVYVIGIFQNGKNLVVRTTHSHAHFLSTFIKGGWGGGASWFLGRWLRGHSLLPQRQIEHSYFHSPFLRSFTLSPYFF